MAVTSTIEYCTDREVQDVFPNLSGFDLKQRIINWATTGTSNLYLARNSGLVTVLFADGEDLGDAEANSGVVDANGEWYYDSNLDTVYYFNDASSPNDLIMEAGDDWATIKTRFRRKASRFVESLIDSRVAREISKDREGNYPEVIVRMTALKSVIFLLQANDPTNEFIDPFNEEFNELLAGIRNGHIVLPNQVTMDSSKGVIRTVTVGSSSDLFPIQLRGNYHGSGYELLKIKIESGHNGIIGVAKMTVYAKNSNELKVDKIIDGEIITGDFQTLHGGLQIRWSGDSVATAVCETNDEYEIELYGSSMDATVSNVGSVGLTRGGRGFVNHRRNR